MAIMKGSYTIAAVSKLTGVSCHALRAWERRYGFPTPHRSQTGHRRYDAEQVRLLDHVVAWVRQGHSIGEVMTALQDGRLETAPAASREGLPAPRNSLTDLVDGLAAADFAAAEQTYDRLTAGLEPARVATQVIEPCFIDIGERWFRNECGIDQEHGVSAFLRRKLNVLLDAAQRATGTRAARRSWPRSRASGTKAAC